MMSRLRRLAGILRQPDARQLVADIPMSWSKALLPGFRAAFAGFNPKRQPTLFVRSTSVPFDNVGMLTHYRDQGFRHVVLLSPDGASPGEDVRRMEGIDLRSITLVGGVAGTTLAALLRRRLVGAWCLFVDDGDILVYPWRERRTIADLCQFVFDEQRRSFFTIRLDLYRDPEEGPARYQPGAPGWRFDHHGFSVREDAHRGSHIWEGGFTQRFLGEPPVISRFASGLSRISLVLPDGLIAMSEDLQFVRPRRHNRPVSPWHLSPTGCVLSDRAWQEWMSWYQTLPEARRSRVREQLLSAPHLPADVSSEVLMEAGLMNCGQWF